MSLPTREDRELYADTLISTLNAWAGNRPGNLSARCVLSEPTGLAVLTVGSARGLSQYRENKASDDLDVALSRIKHLSPQRYGSLMYLRNLAVLDGDAMHIVKPLSLRYWLQSAALNDADSTASYLIRFGGRSR